MTASDGELLSRIEGELRVWLETTQSDRVEIETNGIGLTQGNTALLLRRDEKESVRIPWEISSPQGKLRAAQVLPGRGAWTWCRLWMDASDGVLHQECDWMREPDFGSGAAGAGEYAIELDIYPRDPEYIPEWLAERVAAYEKRKARNARRREARRRKREQERGGD